MPSHRAAKPPSHLRRALLATLRGGYRAGRSVLAALRMPWLPATLRFARMPALLAVALVGLGTQVGPTATTPRPDAATVLEVSGKHLTETLDRHDCSVRGFGPEQRPRSALVRVEGQVQQVSFDEGWAVFTGDLPGELVAVCLAPVAPQRLS